MRSFGCLCLSGALILHLVGPVHGQWSSAVLLNDASEIGQDVKSSKVAASRAGGFHACYTGSGKVQYRRYISSLTAPLGVKTGQVFNPNIDEALSGDVHIVFEDWAGDSPEVGWTRSTNGGTSFSPSIEISATSGNAKYPYICPFGLGTGGEMMMSYWNASTHQYRWNRFNGGSWNGEQYVGSSIDNEYQVHGMARSPLDGTIWRSIGQKTSSNPEDFDIGMRHFNGTSWEAYFKMSDSVFFARQQVAVNDAGQVMVLWDDADVYYSMLYTPGSGSGPKTTVTTQGSWGTSLCSIPGTNDFYTAYPKNGPGRLYGRRWTAGAWQAEEQISQGLPDEFTVGPDVSADPNGSNTIYCVWEYWGSGKPQQYYSIRGGIPPGPQGTISGVVRDQLGSGVAGAMVSIAGVNSTVTAPGGTYSMQAPAGSYTIQASKTFFTSQTTTVAVIASQPTTRDFVIPATSPGPVTTLTTNPGNTSIKIQWANPGDGNYSGTRLLFKTTGVPASPTDGTVLVDDGASPGSSRSFNHTGLTNGQTYYYRAFAYFQDTNRFYASGSPAASGVPAVPVDYDGDGDVDQSDFAQIQLCLTGPYVAITNPACSKADLDSPPDNDVDLADLNIFLGCFSGPDVYADPNCLP